jgi:hypothetical protein
MKYCLQLWNVAIRKYCDHEILLAIMMLQLGHVAIMTCYSSWNVAMTNCCKYEMVQLFHVQLWHIARMKCWNYKTLQLLYVAISHCLPGDPHSVLITLKYYKEICTELWTWRHFVHIMTMSCVVLDGSIS